MQRQGLLQTKNTEILVGHAGKSADGKRFHFFGGAVARKLARAENFAQSRGLLGWNCAIWTNSRGENNWKRRKNHFLAEEYWHISIRVISCLYQSDVVYQANLFHKRRMENLLNFPWILVDNLAELCYSYNILHTRSCLPVSQKAVQCTERKRL